MTLRPLDGRTLIGSSPSRPEATSDAGLTDDIAPWRIAVAFGVLGLGSLSLLATAPGPAITWIAWLTIGFVAGALSGRIGWIWSVLPLVLGAAALAWATGMSGTDRTYWWLGAVVGAALVSTGFVVGAALGSRGEAVAVVLAWWQSSGRWSRRLAVAAWAGLLLVVVAYAGFMGLEGSRQFVAAQNDQPGCTTPARALGWPYEAINYDIASDATLAKRPTGDGTWACDAGPVGRRVVSADDVALAGWYIPAASGIGPQGPTVIVVPGYKASKSDILKYGPAFHDDYNLVLMDVRNVGQSDTAATTMGLREQSDVRAMIDWLVDTKGATTIVLAGDSQGAATSLAEAVEDPRVDALILDSMHASWVVATGNALEEDFGHPSLPGAWAMALGTSARIGDDVTSIDPIGMIARLGDRPVMLSHGTADRIDPPDQSVERNLRAAMEAGLPVELHYCPGATHGQTVNVCPDAWAHWATSFLDGALPR